ncbi:hypothetical protein CDAR_57591 [Caerostris darwini]|uniref:Uncharacterized protein n=1 Tax=Caerostris darwini TaxID=1538125 RepID=A0AAV4SWZ9_9ARAC|nr:hypothetical protein CDAR_57591 [Caerostris darwini]
MLHEAKVDMREPKTVNLNKIKRGKRKMEKEMSVNTPSAVTVKGGLMDFEDLILQNYSGVCSEVRFRYF